MTSKCPAWGWGRALGEAPELGDRGLGKDEATSYSSDDADDDMDRMPKGFAESLEEVSEESRHCIP